MPPDFSGLSELEARVLRLIESRPAPGRHAGRNAFHHLERAKALASLDPEMALFRSITAEEEAVRAIFHALQRRKYPGANRLNWRNHTQKAAVIPFFSAIAALVAKGPIPAPKLQLLEEEGKDTLRLRFEIDFPDGVRRAVTPAFPLDLAIHVDGNAPTYRVELDELLSQASVATVAEWVKGRANERNRLLYATDQGIPGLIGDTATPLADRRGNTFSCLAVYLMIDLFDKHQLFVLQCLPVFLSLFDRLPPPTPDEAS